MDELVIGTRVDDGEPFALPAAYVTDTGAILAKRRTGKSSTATKIAEEMFAAGYQFAIVDPKGDYWGMRSAGDGRSPGLAIPIFGGLRGDVALSPESGAVVAQLVFDQQVSVILDVSRFESKAEQARFLTDFATTLYRLHQVDPRPLHIFLEEADEYLPQVVRSGEGMTICVASWSKLVRLGGAFGLGVTLITQRAASLNKDVLTQIETLVVLRTPAELDRKSIRGWMDSKGGSAEILASLATLQNGEAWVVSSHFLGETVRVQMLPRSTYDSGATPVVGANGGRRQATLADIDLGAVAAQMKAAIEEAADTDPSILHERIHELERKLAEKPAPAEIVIEKEVEVEVVPVELVEAVADLGHQVELLKRIVSGVHLKPAPVRPGAATAAPATSKAATVAAPGDETPLGKAERTVLGVLVRFPQGRNKVQLSVLSGYSIKSSSLGNALGRLRSLGLVEPGSNPIRATAAGIAEASAHHQVEVPAGDDLLRLWSGRLGRAERRVLEVMLDRYPAEVSREELAELSGYSSTSSSLGNALGRLRSLELVDGWRVASAFVEAVGR